MSDTPPVPADAPHKPADDSEQVYFDGSPKLRADGRGVLLWWLIGLVLIALPFVYHFVSNHLWTPIWLTLAMLAAGIICFFVPVLQQKSVRYRISNYRIDFERGVLSKKIDTMELWHVEDISFYQSLADRMLDVGTITVLSHDDTNPRLVISGLPNPRPIFETLKQRIIAVKRQRGVIKTDAGT